MLVLLLFLSITLVSFPQIEMVKAEGTIYIRSDGSVEGTDKIQQDGNVYTFTDDIFDPIVVQRDNIVVDGAGYLLQGVGGGMGIHGITGVSIDDRSNVTVKNIQMKNFFYSIRLRNSSNNTIYGNKIIENHFGIDVSDSSFNIISGNTLTSNNASINIYHSAYNVVSGNTITNNNDYTISISGSFNIISGNTLTSNNAFCIYLHGSSNNTIFGNNITNNERGITSYESSGNMISHNNLINNQKYQIHLRDANATWDDGYPSGGNYWSDYKGTDNDGDAIGDTPYVIDENNTDNYPLMVPIKIFDAGTWEWIPFNVNVVSNSTVSGFSFNPESALIRFNIDGEDGTTGFCRVTIPKDLLTAEDSWTVLVDGASITPTVNEDASNTYLYFTYNYSTKTVEIIGTDAIQEFPSWAILPLLLVATSVAVICKKRLPKNQSNQQKPFISGD